MSEHPTPYNPSPLRNESTQETVHGLGPHRFTRAKMHRLLVAYQVEHNPHSTLIEMYDLAVRLGIPIEELPPGEVQRRRAPEALARVRADTVAAEREQRALAKKKAKAKKKKASGPMVYAEDGWPQRQPDIRKMCRERGIKTMPSDKRADLIKKLEAYMNGLSEARDG